MEITGDKLLQMNTRETIFPFNVTSTVQRPAVEFWLDFKHYCVVFSNWQWQEPPSPKPYDWIDFNTAVLYKIKKVLFFEIDYWSLTSPDYDFVILANGGGTLRKPRIWMRSPPFR